MTDFINEAAKKKLGAPDDWYWWRSEAVTGGFILDGGVEFTDEHGQRSWRKPYQRVVVSDQDIRDAERQYEAETGKCHKCEGTGQWLFGWNSETGNKYKPCPRCNATGTAPVEEQKP